MQPQSGFLPVCELPSGIAQPAQQPICNHQEVGPNPSAGSFVNEDQSLFPTDRVGRRLIGS